MYLGLVNRAHLFMPAADLTTHAVVLGRTGSGKTGLITVLAEDSIGEDASVLVFDPKGDLSNIAIRPAVDEHIREWNMEPSDYWRGLAAFGYDARHADHWRRRCNITIYLPGGNRPVNVFPDFSVPCPVSEDKAARDVKTMLLAIKGDMRPDDVSAVAMTKAVVAHWNRGLPFPLHEWPHYLSSGVFEDTFHTDFFPKKSRLALAKTVLAFLHENGKWLDGPVLDVEQLVKANDMVIMNTRHLTEEQRQAFTAATLARVVDYMNRAPASSKLKLAVILDEARGYLPPYPANPPAKSYLTTLLAQGRAAGIGVVLGTQNPMDIDYKALSNVGTWFIGRLRERDCARDLISELRDRGVDTATIENQPQRGFLLLDKHGKQQQLAVRHAVSLLRGPLTPDEVAKL